MSQVTVTTTATLIVPANTARQSLIIHFPDDVYIGQDSTVTTSNGVLMTGGVHLTESEDGTKLYMGPYYGIVGSGTSSVSYWERTRG